MQETQTDNLALARRWFEEVWNQKREASIHELMSRDISGSGLGEGDSMDYEGFLEFWRGLLRTFPDLHVTIEHEVASGDKVAVHIRCTGTHSDGALGIPPSGKKVTFHAQAITTWRDGKLVHGVNVVDMSPVFRQA